MADVLTNQASFQRAFYRLTDTDSTDEALIEQDTSGDLEAVNQFLQHGVNDAQEYLMRAGLSSRWISQATAITSWSGADSTDGGRYKALETDFFRLAGDAEPGFSALREIDGNQWGRLINARDRFRVNGDRYYLLNEQLWLCRNANPPASVIYDYHHRIATLDSSTIDFPVDDRELIVAYAGKRAMADSWLPGGQEMEAKIEAKLRFCEQQAWKRSRRDRRQRRLRPQRTVGTHYYTP